MRLRATLGVGLVAAVAVVAIVAVLVATRDAPTADRWDGERPYSSTSAWNTPIGADPRIDPRSDRMLAAIDGALSSDPTQYTYPVYIVDADTPRYTIPCTRYSCTVVTEGGATKTSELTGVPIPTGARPSAGTDGQMIIIDPATGTEWDLWQATFDGSRWSAANASVYNVGWDGMPADYGSRGAGVPYLAGLIRPWEIDAGRIEHAIAFAFDEPRDALCVWPASKTDGENPNPDAPPEGARLQLDPRYDESDFDAWGLDRTGRIIARALQKYGMIVIDVSGRPKLYAENLVVNSTTPWSWDESTTSLTSETVEPIPMDAFRVLALPDGYWEQSTSAPMHGDCYR